MKRILIRIQYDGSGFNGYQKQLNGRTVQDALERALSVIHKQDAWPCTSSGRTDTGVHGLNQPVHFDTPLSISMARWPMAMNSVLPDDVQVLEAREVPAEFHARYDTIGKVYRYRIYTTRKRDVFLRHFAHHFPGNLDADRIRNAAAHLEGTHDFTSLSSAKSDVVDKVRTLFRVHVEEGTDHVDLIYVGSGFLYQMVRVMTGTLLKIGSGEWDKDIIPEIIAKKDRIAAGPTAPGNGLYLEDVFYDEASLQDYLTNLQQNEKK